MSLSGVLVVALMLMLTATTVDAFVIPNLSSSSSSSSSLLSPTTAGTSLSSPSTTTTLFAVSALVRKAKEEELRKQIKEKNGKLDDDVMEKYKLIQDALKDDDATTRTGPGLLQSNLIKRKGTITVIAEYKRKIADGSNGYINVNVNGSVTPTTNSLRSGSSTASASITETTEEEKINGVKAGVEANSPVLLSNEFREFGAAGIAVLADERMGGCSYDDLKEFVVEQKSAQSDVPGPVPIINSDIIIDEIQLAQTAAIGATAIVLDYELLSSTDGLLTKLAKAARAVELEIIVAVRSKEEAQTSIDLIVKNCGCSFMVSVVNTEGVDAKYDIINDLQIPNDADDDEKSEKEKIQITTIANIVHRSDQGLAEVEETWALRDKGFNCAWISDALYKAGNSETEHPGAIIQSMAAKSSVRWASPVAKSGRGEGAREYLGDIMM